LKQGRVAHGVAQADVVEERVPGKQGLKLGISDAGTEEDLVSKSEFQENKD